MYLLPLKQYDYWYNLLVSKINVGAFFQCSMKESIAHVPFSRLHRQEIPENGADIAHLGHLHVPSVLKGAELGSVFAKSMVGERSQAGQAEVTF